MNPPKANPKGQEKSENRKADQGQETPWPNEGEGNKTADREYRKGTEAFVKSGRVEEQAQKAAEALIAMKARSCGRQRRRVAKASPSPRRNDDR